MRRSLPIVVAIVLVLLGLLAWRTDGVGILGGHGAGDAVSPSDAPVTAGVDSKLKGANPNAAGADPAFYQGDHVGLLELTLGKAAVTGKVTGEGAPIRFARVLAVLAPPSDRTAVVRTRSN